MQPIKKIALLVFTMLMSWSCFSQKDTTQRIDSIVCLPKSIAKKIAKDLVQYDACKEVNKQLDSSITTLNKQLINRDSVIALQRKQFNLANQQYINASLQYDIVNKQYLSQVKKLKWSKTKTTISQIAILALLIKIALN